MKTFSDVTLDLKWFHSSFPLGLCGTTRTEISVKLTSLHPLSPSSPILPSSSYPSFSYASFVVVIVHLHVENDSTGRGVFSLWFVLLVQTFCEGNLRMGSL